MRKIYYQKIAWVMLMQVVRDLYNNILTLASEPLSIYNLASCLAVSYKTAWSAVNRLKTAGLLTKTDRGYVATSPVTVEDLIKHPFLLRSKHAHGLLLLLNLKPIGVTESARLLGTSPPLIQKVLGWLREDGLVKKTHRKYMLKRHVVGLGLTSDDAAVISAEHLLDTVKRNIKSLIYSQGEFLVTVDTSSYYKPTETQHIIQVMETTGVKGVVLPHFDWLLYITGGFERSPALAHFMLGIPAYGTPWLDKYEMASEFLKTYEESQERYVRKGLAKGLYRKDRKGIRMTERGIRKLISLIKGKVEFVEAGEGINIAKLC